MVQTVKRWLIGGFMLLVVGGCSAGGTDHEGMAHNMSGMSMEPIHVELSWSPEEVKAEEPVTFKAVVTQDGQPVDDAKEVMFEITDQESGKVLDKLQGTLKEKGIYQAEGNIAEAGSYSVTSHVTARTQHSMPTLTFAVSP